MRLIVLTLTSLSFASAALAAVLSLSNQAPEKSASFIAASSADPAVVRQGGDTIFNAVPISIPYSGAGTTVGYSDDYMESCPFDYFSPDVVYELTPTDNMELDIDLCGSSYDTQVFVYDEELNVVACNDDYYPIGSPCGDLTSRIVNMPVVGGATYYVVIDGDTPGDYVIEVAEYPPCVIECPPGAALEEEPPLDYDYVDLHNGGCNTDDADPPFQPITSQLFCGVSGWYFYQGQNYRDTDWFLIDIPAGGVLEITGDAEFGSYMFELGPQDCNQVGVMQTVVIGPCEEATMVVTGAPGATVWLWVGPDRFTSPDGSDIFEYDYVLQLNVEVVATENLSWTEIKALFD